MRHLSKSPPKSVKTPLNGVRNVELFFSIDMLNGDAIISYSHGLAQKPAENSFQINGRGLNFSFHHQCNAIVGTISKSEKFDLKISCSFSRRLEVVFKIPLQFPSTILKVTKVVSKVLLKLCLVACNAHSY